MSRYALLLQRGNSSYTINLDPTSPSKSSMAYYLPEKSDVDMFAHIYQTDFWEVKDSRLVELAPNNVKDQRRPPLTASLGNSGVGTIKGALYWLSYCYPGLMESWYLKNLGEPYYSWGMDGIEDADADRFYVSELKGADVN